MGVMVNRLCVEYSYNYKWDEYNKKKKQIPF